MRPLRAVGAVLVLAAVLFGGSEWAAAHGGNAVIAVSAEATATGVVVTADVTYETDGHAAEGARVRAALVGPDGTEVGAADLLPQGTPGRYQGLVPAAPGSYTVQVTSAFPPGAAQVALAAPEPATPETTPEPATPEPVSSTQIAEQGAVAEAGPSGISWGWIGAGAVVAVALLVGTQVVARKATTRKDAR